jgi:hypothetical protein
VDGQAKTPPDGPREAGIRAPRRGRPRYGIIIWAALALLGVFIVFRQGLLPAAWSPLPALDLGNGNGWLVDWRIAELKHDRALCSRVLKTPHIAAAPVAANPIKDGCGWDNAVRMSNAGGASLSVGTISCEVAAGIAMWLAHEVQPRAMALLGSRVTSVQHFGSYSCRNIAGRKLPIAAFTLANGRQVSVARHWSASGAEARFLHEIHARACRYFRVAIGPEYNDLHRDHFHYDRGLFSRCK